MGLLPNWDSFTHKRPNSTVDAEGNALTGLTTIGAGSGVWGSANAREIQNYANRGERLDAFLSTSYGAFRPGDIAIVRGHTWTVVSVKDVRIHNRVALRNTDEGGLA
jgi:hypothetical protein